VQGKLTVFKRRAANHEERGVQHGGERLSFLFAPGSIFIEASFSDCLLAFSACNLTGASFRGAFLTDVVFDHCVMDGASFEGATLRNVRMVGCEIEGGSFLGAILQRPVLFEKTELAYCDLRFYESESGAPRVIDCGLKGVTVSMNCEFWNGTFDQNAVATFGRVLARASGDEALVQLARERWGSAEYDALDAYMRRD
jgi:hypothetical protein